MDVRFIAYNKNPDNNNTHNKHKETVEIAVHVVSALMQPYLVDLLHCFVVVHSGRGRGPEQTGEEDGYTLGDTQKHLALIPAKWT